MTLRQTSLSFKQMCLQRPEKTENINVKWGSRRTTHVIALSRLSHSSVLPRPSCCVNSLITALARGIAGTLRSHKGDASEKVTEKNVLSVLSNYFMIIPVRSFKSLTFMMELKRADRVWWVLMSSKKWLKICSILVVEGRQKICTEKRNSCVGSLGKNVFERRTSTESGVSALFGRDF